MATLQERIKLIETNPLSQFAGIRQLESHDGEGSLLLRVGPSIINPNEKLHGGILYAFSDVCAYLALLSLLNQNQQGVTHDLHISVMRAANLGDELKFNAKVSKLGRNIAFIKTQVYRKDEIISEATVTKSIINT